MKKDKKKLMSFILCLALLFGTVGAFGLILDSNLSVANASGGTGGGAGSGGGTGSGSGTGGGTGTGSGTVTNTETTTFSAVLFSPDTASLSAINLNNAVFQINFGAEVKKNVIRVGDVVSIQSGADTIASATSNLDGTTKGISYLEPVYTMKDGVTTTAITFTVDPTKLQPSSTYQFKLSGMIKDASSNLSLGEDVIYNFTTTADEYIAPEAPKVSFAAINLYPILNAKNVMINEPLKIGFTESVKSNTKIKNGTAVELRKNDLTVTTVAAILSLNEDFKILTITPSEALQYGTDYELAILDNSITSSDGSIQLPATSLTFKTTSFDLSTITAKKEGTSSASISLNLHNAGLKDQKGKLVYVVRRDKGATLEEGGIVVAKGEQTNITVKANENKEIAFNVEDITKNLVNGELANLGKGKVYVDIYLMNSNGEIIYQPIHHEII